MVGLHLDSGCGWSLPGTQGLWGGGDDLLLCYFLWGCGNLDREGTQQVALTGLDTLLSLV